MKLKKYKSKSLDLYCNCACGQKIRVIKDRLGRLEMIDIGFMKYKEKRPKVGIVLRSDNLKKFKKFII